MTEPSEDLPSAKLFLGRSVCDGCGMVAEGGPEQNLALHLVLFASGNEWNGGRDEERERERERERGALRSDSGLQGRGSLEKELLSGYSGSGSPHS